MNQTSSTNSRIPEVSVITPVYNAATWLNAAIRSVREQTFSNWEMVIIDDGSSDNTRQIAGEAADQDTRIQVHSQPNRGVSAARNLGLSQARGKYVLFLDADDLLFNTTLERLSSRLNADTSGAVAAYGNAVFLSQDGKQTKTVGMTKNRKLPEGDVVEQLLISNFVVALGCLMFRREVAEKAGGLCEGLAQGEDREFFLRLALRGNFLTVDGPPLYQYRIHANSASHKGGKRPSQFDAVREKLFANKMVQERFPDRKLKRLQRLFDANALAASGRNAYANGRWKDAIRYLARSVARNPRKPSRWILLVASLVHWRPRFLERSA